MRKILALSLATAALLNAGPTLAGSSDDDSRRCGNTPRSQWLAIGEIEAKAIALGYKVRKIEIDDGCYEVYATDKAGNRIEAYMHPATAEVVRTELDD